MGLHAGHSIEAVQANIWDKCHEMLGLPLIISPLIDLGYATTRASQANCLPKRTQMPPILKLVIDKIDGIFFQD